MGTKPDEGEELPQIPFRRNPQAGCNGNPGGPRQATEKRSRQLPLVVRVCPLQHLLWLGGGGRPCGYLPANPSRYTRANTWKSNRSYLPPSRPPPRKFQEIPKNNNCLIKIGFFLACFPAFWDYGCLMFRYRLYSK